MKITCIFKFQRDKTIPAIEKDMIKFLRDLQSSGNVSRTGPNWPSLVAGTVVGSTVPDLWIHGAKFAVLVFEEAGSDLGGLVILDLSETLSQLKIKLSVTIIEINTQSEQLRQSLKVGYSRVEMKLYRVNYRLEQREAWWRSAPT